MRLVLLAVLVGAILTLAAPAPSASPVPGVPVLMYHVIAKPPPGVPYPALYVPQTEFAAQMSWLAGHDYRAVTLDRLYAAWHGGPALPRKPVVLTFDDGSASIARNALPVLRKLRWPGVLNLKLDNVVPAKGISPEQVQRLIRAGFEIDSHTFSHPDLTTLSASALKHEVQDSRWAVQRRFREPARFFCYPAGRYDARVIAAVRAAGYRGATSTRPGLARPDELYTLARVRVDGGDDASGLARKLRAVGG